MTRAEARKLMELLAAENRRAAEGIRVPGYPRPYFLSYLVRDVESWRIEARYGTVFRDRSFRRRHCWCDARVGSYSNDQVMGGGLDDNDADAESYEYVELPVGTEPHGVQHALWRLTDVRYREAVDALLQKKADGLSFVDRGSRFPSFERRDPVVDESWRRLPDVDVARWLGYVRRASRVPQRDPEVKHSYVTLTVDHVTQLFVSSEGSRIIQRMPYWQLSVYLWMLSQGGLSVPWELDWFVADPAELPDARALNAAIRHAVKRLHGLCAAPTLRPYSGPVLLDPVPAGLLIHEAVGHRLEGNRLLADDEGQTFRGGLGRDILPPFLSVRDDPTLERYEGRSLAGHYRYDDEGVPAACADLIRDGRLRGFLTSRTAVSRRHCSNGHARGDYHERPIARMGVTVVEAEGGLAEDRLRQVFLDEIRRQGLDYGVRILKAQSGETSTDAYNFQAFLGDINLASRVWADGREELVRGVNFVGTPLNAVRSIIAAGDRYEVDNAWCGAESGDVPVSTVSPSLLVSHLELQSKADKRYTQYAYPMPWADGAGAPRPRAARRSGR